MKQSIEKLNYPSSAYRRKGKREGEKKMVMMKSIYVCDVPKYMSTWLGAAADKEK